MADWRYTASTAIPRKKASAMAMAVVRMIFDIDAHLH
jgi:hypothetical protein